MRKKQEEPKQEEPETCLYDDLLNDLILENAKAKLICDLALAEKDRRAKITPPTPPKEGSQEMSYKDPSQ